MKHKPIVIALLAALSACNEIFETDISGRSVEVIAPLGGTEIVEGRASFRWSALDGADRYRVVIVSPGFENARFAARDTVLYRDSLFSMSFGFYQRLAPASYEWSIQGFNGAYESLRSVYAFTVVPEPEPEEPEEPDPDSETTEPGQQ